MAIINIINERTETDSGSDLDIFGNDMSNSSVTNTVNERIETELLEPQSTNLVTYSEDFSQLTSKTNITITDNQVISLDGSLNAASIIDNSVNGIHRTYTIYSSSAASGQVVSHSVFAKAKEQEWFQLSTGGDTNDQFANYDLKNGVIGNSSSSANAKMENYGNGWYRCILSATTSTNNANLAALLTLINNSDINQRGPSYAGNGQGVYVYGLQIEVGTHATSYIPTSGYPVTREAEVCKEAFTNETNQNGISVISNTLNERVETDNGSTLDVFGNNMSNSNIVNTIIERVIGVTYIQTLLNALRSRATYFENEDCTTDTLTNLENI